MKLIRTILESDKEPLFKEVGWLHSINGRLSLDFYKNGKWESVSSNTAVNINEDDLAINDNKIEFADRHQDSSNLMGYKIVRKNIINGKNIITQDMINTPNTVYEIRYNFDLNVQELIIPSNCILQFNGGSVNNGTLRNCFIYKVKVKTPEDINLTCGIVNTEGSVYGYLNIGDIKKGVTYKKISRLIDNEDDYRISFSNKTTNTEIEVEVTLYVKAFSDDTFSVNSIRNPTIGSSSDRPSTIPTGFKYYDTTLNKFIWWNGNGWVDGNNNNANSTYSGIFSQRPSNPSIGFAYFCIDRQTSEGSTNGIVIYYKGNSVWVDALGRVIS